MNPSWTQGDPNAVIHIILAQPEFRALKEQSASPSAFEVWLRNLIAAVRAWLHHLFQATAGLAHVPTYVLLLILCLLGACGLLVIAYVLITQVAFRRRPRALHRQTMRTQQEHAPEAMREQAERAATDGEYSKAITLLFRAALFLLDRERIVTFHSARTPREYRRAVRRALQRGADAFEDVARRFVAAAFGVHAAQRDDYLAARRAYDAFVPLATGT